MRHCARQSWSVSCDLAIGFGRRGSACPGGRRSFQDQYSAQIMRITSRLEVDATGDRAFGYQQSGLLMLDPTTSQLALCFGRGRLQNALEPIGAIPIAEIGGDLTELNLRGDRL